MTRIFGYTTCSNPTCNGAVLPEIAYATGGLCTPCWDEASGDRRRTLDVMIDGRTAKMAAKPAKTAFNRRRNVKRRGNAAYQAKKALAKLVKARAQRRLALLHPDEYLILLADERSKAGLDPWPTYLAMAFRDACRRPEGSPSVTLGYQGTYDPENAEAEGLATSSEPGNGPG